MDIQNVLFVLRFVCGDCLPCYRNHCNLYFKLFHRSVLKKKLSFLARKRKNPEISNRYFFFSCRHEHAWWFWQEICTQVGGPRLLLFTTWLSKGQQTPKIRKFALCTMTKNLIVNLHVNFGSFTIVDNQNHLTASMHWFRNTDNLWSGNFWCRFGSGLYI